MNSILTEIPGGVIAVVGAGGKTSFMFGLAKLLAGQGMRVLTTTTTKIFVPTDDQCLTVFVDPDPGAVLRAAAFEAGALHVTAAASAIDGGKLKGFDADAIDTFQRSGQFDWIIVEADGAARRPLKAPAEHEPVIPGCTAIVVGVAGLDVLGAPFSEETVFRSALAGPLMGLTDGDAITDESLVRLFVHERGLFKNAARGMRRVIFLNKADTEDRKALACDMARLVSQSQAYVADTLIAGTALGGLNIAAEYRQERVA